MERPATSVCERRAEQDGGQGNHNQSRRANPPKVCRNGGHDKDIRRDVIVWGPSEGRCVVRSMSSAKGRHHFGPPPLCVHINVYSYPYPMCADIYVPPPLQAHHQYLSLADMFIVMSLHPPLTCTSGTLFSSNPLL